MLEKIRQISWVQWSAMVGGFIILTVLGRVGLSYIDDLNALAPWSNALHVSSRIAIRNFAGETTGNTTFVKQRLAALFGIILYFIVGPGLLILYGYESKSSSEESSQRMGRWSFKAGIVIILMCIIPFTLGAILTPIVQSNTRKSTSRNEKADELRQHLILMGADSFEYVVLPKSYGGGDGSFEGLQLDDLPGYDRTPSNSYSIQETNSDSVLKIVARGKPDYAVDPGDLEEVSVSIEVGPSRMMELQTLKERSEGGMSLITKFNQPLKAGWAEFTK